MLSLSDNIQGLRNEFYCIVAYDVKVDRVHKVNKLLKMYLNHKQNSVFTGKLSKSEFIEIEKKINEIISENEDEVCFWIIKSENQLITKGFGKKTREDDEFFY